MYTVKDLKERFVNYLMTMDLDKMDVQELSQYGYIVKTVDEMEKPGYAEALSMALNGFGGHRDDKKEE